MSAIEKIFIDKKNSDIRTKKAPARMLHRGLIKIAVDYFWGKREETLE